MWKEAKKKQLHLLKENVYAQASNNDTDDDKWQGEWCRWTIR